MKRKQMFCGALALCLVLSLTLLPAGAQESGLAASADQAAERAMQYGQADSVQYALWEDGAIILTGHRGNYSRTENRALTDEILYGVGSVSKMYTTAAVMKLAEAGRLALDTPVKTYLPDFKMADERFAEITVRMLLNHSSGLMGSTFTSGVLFNDPDETAADMLLERLSTQTLKASPGAFSVYCNDGFTLAQLVVEAVSGMDFDEYVQQAILEPAGLESTYFPGDPFDPARLARTYLGSGDRALPQETLGVHGTGGIYATASDLAAFGGLFCGTQLLTQASLDAMAAPEYAGGLWPEDVEDAIAYGLGWDSVQWYPFAYSDIRALVKGGDTTLYHGGLVVLPEYGLSCAVLSSGGVSTYNEMAASQILIAALERKGTHVDTAAHSLPQARSAAMPEELLAYAGLYASSSQVTQLALTEDGMLTLGESALRYHSDGSFRNEAGNLMVRFVEAENGETYLWQKYYIQLPGLGELPGSSYVFQKLKENPVPEAVQAAWDARNGKIYLCLNEKYSSQALALALPAAGLASLPGYMAFDRIVDENYAEGVAVIPGLAGRDWQNVRLFEQDGVEYAQTSGMLCMDAAAVPAIYAGAGSYSTIQSDGYIRWYRTGSAAGKHMQVQVPEGGGFTVYDGNGQTVAASWMWGDTAVTLPEGGYIAFAGAPGLRFQITMAER